MDCSLKREFCQRTTFNVSRDFLLACEPRPKSFATPPVSSLLETLSEEESAHVSCLEWLLAVSYVRSALDDPERREKLLWMVERYSLDEFKPLLFGRTSLVSEFILEHTPALLNVDVRIEIQRQRMVLQVHFTSMCCHYEEDEVPVHKISEFSQAALRRPFHYFIVTIDADVVGVQNIEEEIVQKKGEICPERILNTSYSTERCRFLEFH